MVGAQHWAPAGEPIGTAGQWLLPGASAPCLQRPRLYLSSRSILPQASSRCSSTKLRNQASLISVAQRKTNSCSRRCEMTEAAPAPQRLHAERTAPEIAWNSPNPTAPIGERGTCGRLNRPGRGCRSLQSAASPAGRNYKPHNSQGLRGEGAQEVVPSWGQGSAGAPLPGLPGVRSSPERRKTGGWLGFEVGLLTRMGLRPLFSGAGKGLFPAFTTTAGWQRETVDERGSGQWEYGCSGCGT